MISGGINVFKYSRSHCPSPGRGKDLGKGCIGFSTRDLAHRSNKFACKRSGDKRHDIRAALKPNESIVARIFLSSLWRNIWNTATMVNGRRIPRNRLPQGLGQLGVLVELLADLLAGGHDRGVVLPPEGPSDDGVGGLGLLPAEVHGGLACQGDVPGSLLGAEFVHCHVEVSRRGGLDLLQLHPDAQR